MDTSKATKPPKIAAWRNILYVWGKLKKYEGPGYFFLLPLSILLEVAAPLLAIALPSAVISLYQSGQSWQRVFAAIVLYAAALALANLGRTFCQGRRFQYRFLTRYDSMEEAFFREIDWDYQEAESDSGRELQQQALRCLIKGQSIGFEALLSAVDSAFIQFFGFAVYLAISASLNGFLLLVLLASTLGIFLLNLWKRRWQHRHYYDESTQLYNRCRELADQLLDSKYTKDIHLYRMKSWLLGTLRSIQGLSLSLEHRQFRALFSASLGQQLLALVRDVLVYGYLIREMLRGNMSVASFILYTGVTSGIASWLDALASQILEVQSNSHLVSSYRLYMDELPGKRQAAAAQDAPVPNPGKAHELRLEHVSFQYPNAEGCALADVNLTLRPGEKLALVGANGAGKTTLVKLLCGLYRPTGGTILLDGVDVSTLNREDYYREFAVVFQDIFALAFPLEDNVTCRPSGETDQARLTESLRQADLLEKVEGLPKGVKTSLLRDLDPEGVEMSGGQMQRLMLARALYKDAPVVLLDEPTAALDPLAEQDLYRHYERFIQGKSSVFISHRLSSTRFCDRILFLENGRITETGSHDELMARGGSYAHMFDVQSHYYREKESEAND